MSFAIAGAAITAGVGIYTGIKQSNAAKSMINNNQFQAATVPQAALDNQAIARQLANTGLPSQQYADAAKSIQRSRVAALRNASDRRLGAGLIPAVQQGYDDSMARLNSADANARLNNTKELMASNSQVAGYQNNAWAQNNYNRRQNYDYGMDLLGAGNANIIGGIDSGLSGLIRWKRMQQGRTTPPPSTDPIITV